ncbi:MAG: branched chain amino acid aminotransferase, partial [bacterium]
MQELEWIWVNGELVRWQEAKTHVLTHALHYGTAVFEGIRCYKTSKGPAVFRLDEHIRRLFDSAHIIKMCLPYGKE